jgi:hypothetical protein
MSIPSKRALILNSTKFRERPCSIWSLEHPVANIPAHDTQEVEPNVKIRTEQILGLDSGYFISSTMRPLVVAVKGGYA